MARKRQTKKHLSPKDYTRPLYKGAWEGMYTFWKNPAMWSDQVVYKTLRGMGGKPYTARDVRSMIKTYCKIMRQYVQKSKNW
jgi:hypothetical protein